MSLRRWLGIARSLVVYHGQPWRQPRRRAFYGQFLRPGDLAFDVGAHVGDRVGTWRRLGARVVAVEPQPDFAAVLRRLYGRDPDVRIEPVALGRHAGRATLHVSRASPTVSTLSTRFLDAVADSAMWAGVHWDDALHVEVRTLDELVAVHGVPRFVKIDVEGHESEVLAGLSHAVDALSLEILPQTVDDALACVDRLAALGDYRYRYSPIETMRWLHPDWLGPDAIRAWLRGRPRHEGRSGDLYARREAAPVG